MNIELLDMLAKACGIGGVCIGIYLIIIVKTLNVNFLKLFPKKTAAFMVVFTLALTWTLAALGILVSVNSNMQNDNLQIQGSNGKAHSSSVSSVESTASNDTSSTAQDVTSKSNSSSKINDANGTPNTSNSHFDGATFK